MDGLRWVPRIEFSELRMMSVIAQSGWGCASCPWRCVCVVCVCVCVCHGWLGTCGLMCSVLLQFNRFCINSLLSLCQSITSIHSVMLLFLFIHFFLLHSFTIVSLPLIPVELSLDCYSALSSIVLLIYLSLFSLSAPLPLSYLTLFVSHSPVELPDWSNIYSYLPKGPISKELLLPRQQIFSLQILQGVVTAHLRVKCCCQPFVRLNVK